MPFASICCIYAVLNLLLPPSPPAGHHFASSGLRICSSSSFWDCVTGMELTSLGKLHLGLPALMTRIDWMFNRHLNESWVPGELAKNAEERGQGFP